MTQNKESEVQLPVYLMIRRGKTTIFFDAFENTKIVDLKKMLQGITKRPADDMRLFKENPMKQFAMAMDNMKTLSDLGFTSTICSPQSPGVAALVYRIEGNDFEPVEIEPYSVPPELPEVMKSSEGQSQQDEKKG